MKIPDLLAGYRAKVSRAKEHFDALKVSVNSFALDIDAYSVIKEADPELGTYTFRLKVHREPPIVDWSLMIGDCIHNMRSALDHLFWALILLKNPNGIAKENSRATFPILKDRNTFNGRKSELENWLGKDVARMLERMQPYQSAGYANNAFVFIHECDINDKHKLLLPLLGIVERGEVEYAPRCDCHSPHIHHDFPAGGLHDGAVIMKVTITPASGVMDVSFNPTIGIIFDQEPAANIVLPALESLISVVESVGRDFAKVFVYHDIIP